MSTSRLDENSLSLNYGDSARTFGGANKDGGVYPEARTTRSVQVSSANVTVGNAQAMACVSIRDASCATTGIERSVPQALQRGTQIEVEHELRKTEAILHKRKGSTISSRKVDSSQTPKYYKYATSNVGESAQGEGKERIVRVQEAAADPLEPPKFRQKKLPPQRSSPQQTVVQSPPRKLSEAERLEWVIPSSVSNWKNPRGYTIPLDKRLAADGRGLQSTKINDNFAKLSEALYIAEQKSRDAVDSRSRLQAELQSRADRKQEELLRQMATEINKHAD